MKIKITLLLILLVVASIGLFVANNRNKLVLVVDYGDKKQTFQVVEKKESAWNLLQQAAAVAGFDLRPVKGFYPQKIDGFANGKDNKKWYLYVNGVKTSVSPYSTYVQSPSRVEFRFE